jgi:DHA1 family bicyclomycin/chloramphenicol resistance-like MFS transporter
VLAKESLDAGTTGFGILVGASGLGLTIGSPAATPLLERAGVRGGYGGAIGVMAVGYGIAAVAPTLPVAVAGVAVGGLGNGIAVVCNSLLIQQGAPDALRGRAFTVIMSSNYVLLGLAMAASGPLVDTVGPRGVWGGAAVAFVLASLAALVLARGVKAAGATKLEEPIVSRV